MLKTKELMEMSSYFQIPRWTKKARRKMSKASIDLQDYLFYEFSNDWSNGYGVFFIARLAKDLEYSQNTIRKALNECITNQIFLLHDLGVDGKLIFKNNIPNQELLNDILEGKKSVKIDFKSTIKILNDKVTPFKKVSSTPKQNEGVPLTVVEGMGQSCLRVPLNCSEGLSSSQSIDITDSQDTPRKYIENIKENSKRKDNLFTENIDENNVENIYPTYLNKSEDEQIKKAFDDLLDGRLDITVSNIDSLKKQASKFRKVRPVAETIELIKLLPEFIKASKIKNTDKVYEDKQTLVYLIKILENDLGSYPKWFLDSQKQEVINNKVADMETVWKQTVKIWDCHYAGRIDDCIKKMVEKILNFVIESENYKKAGKPDNVFLSRFRGVFNQSCINTLEVKKLSEMIEIINEYINKSWNKSDVFCEVIKNFTKNGYSLETIESYFLQNKAGV